MFEVWQIIPVSAFFGMISMLFGIGVAPMFLPYFVLVVDLPFSAAIAATLFIEIAGFSVGLVSFIRKKLVAYHIAHDMLLHTIPAVVIGVLISSSISSSVSIMIFSCVLFIIAALIIHPEHEVLFRWDDPAHDVIVSEYGIARNISVLSGTVSGLIAGLTGTGVGEINNYVFLKKFRMNGQVAAATSMFVIAITAFVGASGHAIEIFLHDQHLFSSLGSIIFAGSLGVIIGVIIGSASKISVPDQYRERYVATIFVTLAVLGIMALLA